MRNPVLFLLVCVFAMQACKNTTENMDSRLVFRYNQNAGISSLDPAFARNQNNIWAVNQLFNGLLQFDDQLNIQPSIARDWNISEDGLTYTFNLRNDVYFNDNECFKNIGRIVTAKDFEYSFNRIIDPATASSGSWIFNDKVADSQPFQALDDSTFVINLKFPFRPLMGILTMQYCSVLPKEAIEFYGKDFRTNPVGTGPFYVDRWIEEEVLILRKNPGYFESTADKPLPVLEKVVVSFIENKSTEFLVFLDGNLDFVSDIDAGLKDLVLSLDGDLQPKYRDQISLIRAPFLNTEYLGFNVDSMPGLTSEQFRYIRKAINYGFDRKEMVTYLRNNKGIPAEQGMIPFGLPAFDPGSRYGYTYQPEKAKEMLKLAGFPNGQGLEPISLYAPTTYMDICEFIQSQLQMTGLPLKIEITQSGLLRTMMEDGKTPFFRASWIADYPDAESYTALFYSPYGAPPNYTHYYNPAVDSLYLKASNENDNETRYKMYRMIDSLVMDDAAVVPLFYDEVYRFKQNNVEGLGANGMNLLNLKNVVKH